MGYLPIYIFRLYVQHYPSTYSTRTFSYPNPILCMAFMQLAYRKSLYNLPACHQTKLYRTGT